MINLALADWLMMITQAIPLPVNAFSQDFWMYGIDGCHIYAITGSIFGECGTVYSVTKCRDIYRISQCILR